MPKETGNGYRCYTAEFLSAYTTRFPEINAARGIYLQPVKKGTIPLVTLLHGIGKQGVLPCRLLAVDLVKRGYACFVLYLPYHADRMTEDMRRRFPFLTAAEWHDHYLGSVINTRQVLDWAETRPEIETGETAVFGLSMGGFIAAITMGLENRLKAGVLAATGGNDAKITQSSRWTKRKFLMSDEEYQNMQEVYARYLAEVAREGFEAVKPPRQSFQTDPLTFAAQLRGRPLQMFNALWDETIPRVATLDFWEACGRPEITWLPATHATMWLYYPLIKRRIGRFLQEVFQK